MTFFLPDAVQEMCSRLCAQQFQAYVVGGCIRDAFLGLTPHDYDIATNARPEEIIRIFGRENCSEYGRAFGTVGVKYAGGFAEITTFRTETDYTDYRHPGKVLFADSILEDLARRDFTCNAMAWDFLNQQPVDPFGGLADLQNGILRCVGIPSARFREDALRILRGMRFCARFGFQPDQLTESAMHAGAFFLQYISAERIFSELCNMLMGEHITEILLSCSDILAVSIPEILPCIAFSQHTVHHDFTVWEHTAKAVGNAPCLLPVRLTMLFHDLAKPQCFTIDSRGGHFKGHAEKSACMADHILTRLKSDNHLRKQVCRLIACHREIPEELYHVRKLLSILDNDEFAMLLQVFEADRLSKLNGPPQSGDRIQNAESAFRLCRQQQLCCRIKDLAVNGTDMLKLGLREKQIGRMLGRLLEAVMHDFPNEKEPLMKLAEDWL